MMSENSTINKTFLHLEKINDFFDYFDKWYLKQPLWGVFLFTAFYMLIILRFGEYGDFYYKIVSDPFHNTINDPVQDWRISDLGHTLVIYGINMALGAKITYQHFLISELSLLTAALIGFVLLLRISQFREASAVAAFVAVILTSPALGVATEWIGDGDVLTLFCLLGVLATPNIAVLAIATFIGCLNHTAIFVLSTGFILAARHVDHPARVWRSALVFAVACVLALAIKREFFLINELHFGSRFGFYLWRGPWWFIRHAVKAAPIILWTAFGPGWLFVAVAMRHESKRFQAIVAMYIFAVCFGINFFIEDNTRVTAILAFPIMIECLRRAFAAGHQQSAPLQRWAATCMALNALLPHPMIHCGGIIFPGQHLLLLSLKYLS